MATEEVTAGSTMAAEAMAAGESAMAAEEVTAGSEEETGGSAVAAVAMEAGVGWASG